MIEVVDPDEPERVVGYGETGRVRLTTLTREFFMPRFLERDEAEREPPCEPYPWDGVRNVRPFSRFGSDRGRRSVLRQCFIFQFSDAVEPYRSLDVGARPAPPHRASRSSRSARPTSG